MARPWYTYRAARKQLVAESKDLPSWKKIPLNMINGGLTRVFNLTVTNKDGSKQVINTANWGG